MQGSPNCMASNSFWRGLVMFQMNISSLIFVNLFTSLLFVVRCLLASLEDPLNLFGIDRDLHCHSSGLATVNMQLCIECIA